MEIKKSRKNQLFPDLKAAFLKQVFWRFPSGEENLPVFFFAGTIFVLGVCTVKVSAEAENYDFYRESVKISIGN